MPFRSSLVPAGLWVLIAAGILALPACNRKRAAVSEAGGPPSPEQGAPFGPPGGWPGGPGAGTQPPVLPNPPGPMGPSPQPPAPGLPFPPRTPVFARSNAFSRQTAQNHLRQIALALHEFEMANGALPLGIADRTGRLGLSWRVAVLPFLGQDALYKQFRLDEPWDSDHNRQLIPRMPAVFGAPNVPTEGYTFYRTFVGDRAVMPPPAQPGQPGRLVPGGRLATIPDGPSSTLLVAEAAEPVIWTKPDELLFAPGRPPRLGGGLFGDGFHAAFCDGSVRYLPLTLDTQTLSHLIQVDDGQVVNLP